MVSHANNRPYLASETRPAEISNGNAGGATHSIGPIGKLTAKEGEHSASTLKQCPINNFSGFRLQKPITP